MNLQQRLPLWICRLMENEDYSVPTPAARIVGIALLVCGGLLLALILPLSDWYVETLESIRDAEKSRRILIASTMLPTILFATLTTWLLTLGHRTISFEHWPPKGMPILFRTRIYNGHLAKVNGVICFLAGGFTGVIAVFWSYMTWISYNL